MAEINERPQGRQSNCKQLHRPKRSTRVDLTPMVDLGFLLLSFFVFTSALSQPMAMNLSVPNDKDSTVYDQLCESCVLTLLLGKNNTIWYAEGKANFTAEKQIDYSPAGIRRLILQKKKAVLHKRGQDQFVLIIKPADQSTVKNLVDIVDECSISMVKRYYIDELTTEEKKWLQNKLPTGNP